MLETTSLTMDNTEMKSDGSSGSHPHRTVSVPVMKMKPFIKL